MLDYPLKLLFILK